MATLPATRICSFPPSFTEFREVSARAASRSRSNLWSFQTPRKNPGGMIRRLEIAQSMLHRPAVLFLDEPTVGLDPVAKRAVWARIQALRGEFDTTIFMTTHDMGEANRLCDIVAFMHSGRILAQDSPANLKAQLGPQATLGDVFIHYAGTAISEAVEEGDWRNVSSTRDTARRLG